MAKQGTASKTDEAITVPAKPQRADKGGRHRAKKLNRDKVQELAKTGISATDIAKHQGVAVSTVTRYLDSVKPMSEQISKYSAAHADILTLSQLKKQAVEDLIIENILSKPEELKRQELRVQKELLHTIQGGKYYDHQSERLERGQSTDNQSVIVTHIRDLQSRLRGDDVNRD